MFSCSQALAFRSHRFKSLLGIPDARVQFTAAEVFGRDEAKLLEAIDPVAAMKAGATTKSGPAEEEGEGREAAISFRMNQVTSQ